jgi:hypothetical protein
MQDGLPFVIREIHFLKKKLAIINAPSLQASLIDVYHDISFRFILEDDSISLTSKSLHSFLFRQGGRVMVGC